LTILDAIGIMAQYLVVTTGRITFMEHQLIDNTEDLKDSIIDRLHYLADMGDYLSACAVYEEFRETLMIE
jgi:hypothetical protein